MLNVRVPLAVPLDAGAAVAPSAGAATAGAVVALPAGAAVGAAGAAGAAVGAAAGWLVELPQAASAPANATARIAIQIRRYIELCLLPNYYASLIAVPPQCTRILPPCCSGWDEKSMRSRSFSSCKA